LWRGKLSTPQWRRNEMGGKHMLIDSLDRELRGSTTNLSRFSEERRAVSIVEGKAVNASTALSVARSLGQNQRATATEILLVEMFHHSQSQSHMRMQIVSPHGTCPCPHFRRVNRANHMVPKVSIFIKTSFFLRWWPHGLLADVASGK
jgi:hypothetical protein